MNNKEQERTEYIKNNKLQDSFIEKKLLFQYRNVIPERKYIGKTKDYAIFFEETTGSLVKRNYGKTTEITSWNLLYSNGEKSEKITKENINNFDIEFNENYSREDIDNYLNNNSRRKNALNFTKTDKKPRQIWVNDDEYLIVREFIRKMRLKNE